MQTPGAGLYRPPNRLPGTRIRVQGPKKIAIVAVESDHVALHLVSSRRPVPSTGFFVFLADAAGGL